jgi:ABC-type transport system involved in cytochrome bd biosynthesis fused ATPase/permease subunit
LSASLAPASSEVVVAAPMSFAGSAQRIWKLTKMSDATPALIALSITAVVLIGVAWAFVLGWYMVFGLLLVPYRLIRRGQRKNKRDNMRHQELLQAMAAQSVLASQQLHQQVQAPLAVENQAATEIAPPSFEA